MKIFTSYRFYILHFAFYILHFNPLSAQTEIDNQIWQGLSLEYEVSKKLTLHLSDELRLENNSNDFQQNLVQLHATYQISKALRVLGGYRFSLRPIYDRHRLYIEPLLRHELDNINIEIQLSTKLQYEFDKRPESETFYVRPMLFARYEPKYSRFEPFIATELFYRASPESVADQFRIYTGLEYKLTKKNTLRLTYIRARDLTETNFRYNIFSAAFIIEIAPPKKKKKKK